MIHITYNLYKTWIHIGHIPRALIRTFYCVWFFYISFYPIKKFEKYELFNIIMFDYLYEYKIILMFHFSLYILSSRASL